MNDRHDNPIPRARTAAGLQALSEPSTRAEWLDRHEKLGYYERVGYVGLGERFNRWIYRLRRSHFLRLARRHGLGSPGQRALDVGFGSGFYLGLLNELGVHDVRGVDVSPRAVQRAREAFPTFRFEVCDVSDGLPPATVSEGGFDWVLAMDMLYHIVEDELFCAALGHCGRAVRRGGRLLVSDNFPSRRAPSDAHQAYHTLAEYESVLAPLGFRPREVSPVFFLSNGQVPDGGIGGRIMSAYWSFVSRGLGKAIRMSRHVGEMLGDALGCVLTSADAMLQRQSLLRGYSTKTALFERT